METRFKYLPHTADIQFVAYGRSMGKAIENSALAMLNAMLDLKRLSKVKAGEGHILIHEKASTIENLVWFTLQNIITKRDQKDLNAFRFAVSRLVKKDNRFMLTGRLYYKKDKSDYTLMDIKAVTPHDLKILKKGKIYSINIVADV